MIMKILIIGLIMLLSGCTVIADQKDIEFGNRVCMNNGGLKYIVVHKLGFYPNATCNNGAIFNGNVQNYDKPNGG